MSTDAAAAAPGRPEPSGGTGAERRDGIPAVPPPRSAPPDETTEPTRAAKPDQGKEVAPGQGTAPGQAAQLTERERRILDFEQQWWRHAGAKEQAIRDTFGLSATRYYQLLNGLLDNPAALAAEPLLIGRLRRLRSSRARNRRR
ncbi:DUF3263 domain-containing protein [Micromonospora sp. PLK6-60]|uniref:DUF3263 domain-containing protein n=1 Tax=Micromonospora sp. PLK6-60 TaxID=2873383 RepID=UPI001CA7218D|nr:DUF3263 domain-containing protein [Micromonospora sp. PLK6-60]MBY8873102.1 DUF3263 domain-containing protein [Micromonospora sp. PLK6-60]